MFYRFEVKNSEENWVGIFSIMNPTQRRYWRRILHEPKWYEIHEDTPSRCWFTEKGYAKYKDAMAETISELSAYREKEIRLITARNLDNIAMRGRIQCIERLI